MFNRLCTPALIYLAFSLSHIFIDMFKHMYNSALMKFFIMILFATLLNILCERGLSIISWIIVFIPFIMMTILTTILLFIFGLSPSSGKIDYKVEYESK
jgi:hypothetical protein